jgi:hypothetical protein
VIAGLALLVACATPAVNQTSALEGRWLNTGGRFHLSDGNTTGPLATCRVEFAGSRSVTECISDRGRDRIVSSYRLVAPGVLESEVIENKNFPQVIGARTRIEFRIENGTLFTTAYPAAPAGPTVVYPVKIEATWVRE